MAVLRPFSCIRPQPELAAKIASGPHSAMSQDEIRKMMEDNPLSYSRIVHPRLLQGRGRGDAEKAYQMAADTLTEWVEQHIMVRDRESAFYLYRLESGGHVQTGLVGRTSVDDLFNRTIRAHEKVRDSKLQDLAHHMEICRAQIGGPILMAYRKRREVTEWMESVAERPPLYDFLSENGIQNTIWKISDSAEMAWVEEAMGRVPSLYISDGHHRVMAAAEICRRRREAKPDYTGEEPWNWFTCVCFPDDQLRILPYSRMVEGLNGRTEAKFLEQVARSFRVEACAGRQEAIPERRGQFGMYLSGQWRRLTLREELRPQEVPDSLDVAVLGNRILRPILGIGNVRNDSRLEFIGGLKQPQAVEDKCRKRDRVGFLLHPTSMEELLAVADAGATMPPKSTWFEPKLCNGLFIRPFEEENCNE
ncbi:MAG: DUF1015 family protein [Lachnospiraceae bacterium]|nr:DUF1015 family protein [Lachnospiraceae bacterium]